MRRRSNNSAVVIVFIALAIISVVAYKARQTGAPPSTRSQSGSVETRIGPQDIYPDPFRTPGTVNPDIRQDNIDETICNPDWSTKSVRPPVNYTDKLKREQTYEYGDSDTNPRDYEEDHLIPLELGGNSTDPRNLWPERYDTSIAGGGARSKDKVESYLHRQVCSEKMSLDEAQHEIAHDWYRVYVMSMRRN
jgi:hypothetical protein